MLIPLVRTMVLAALFLPLAACTSGPQQPSDVVDDQSTAALDGNGDTQGTSPDFSTLDNVETDPVRTGTAAATQPPATLTDVVGQWAADAAMCVSPGPEVTITATRFETLERACDIADAVDGGNGKLTVGLRCTSPAGDVDSELVKLAPTDSGLDLTVVGGDAGPQSLVRCP